MREQDDLRQRYQRRQRQGKQDLRFLTLLLFLGLLLYSALSFYTITRLTSVNTDLYIHVALSVFGTLLMWCLPLRMLWKYNKLGRLLYWLCLFISIYLYKDVFAMKDAIWTPIEYKYIFIALFGFKCVILLYGGIKLMTSHTIRGIWNIDDLFDEELAEMEVVEETPLLVETPLSKGEERAKFLLKRIAVSLGLCLYISMIFIFVLLGFLAMKLPTYRESINAIQYLLFSECLFSALLWSVPMIVMYMGKPWSPYLLYVAMAGEVMRIALSYMQYVELFQNRVIMPEIKILFLVIACLRYLILFYSYRHALTHSLIRSFRKRRSKNNE